MIYDVWWLGSISQAVHVFIYFDMFYIQWHHLVKKDLWNKVYMNEWIYSYNKQNLPLLFSEQYQLPQFKAVVTPAPYSEIKITVFQDWYHVLC
jgi:hypothetical protein